MGEEKHRWSGGKPEDAAGEISWYDALRYCNALSERTGLTPVYEFGPVRKRYDQVYDEDLEVTEVRWDRQADGFRLPTEAEWEYAARAGEMTAYAGGDKPFRVGWFEENAEFENKPVGLKTANAWGLRDMSGNVWEWCWDWASKPRETASATDPIGPDSGEHRVQRGGSSGASADDCPLDVRGSCVGTPGVGCEEEGLRLVRNAPDD